MLLSFPVPCMLSFPITSWHFLQLMLTSFSFLPLSHSLAFCLIVSTSINKCSHLPWLDFCLLIPLTWDQLVSGLQECAVRAYRPYCTTWSRDSGLPTPHFVSVQETSQKFLAVMKCFICTLKILYCTYFTNTLECKIWLWHFATV